MIASLLKQPFKASQHHHAIHWAALASTGRRYAAYYGIAGLLVAYQVAGGLASQAESLDHRSVLLHWLYAQVLFGAWVLLRHCASA